METASPFRLSAAQLKWIALISMVIDHVAYFFELPVFLRWIGRLAAPIFLYFVVEGFCRTHDLKKYLLRMYAVAVLMGVANYLLANYATGVRQDGLTPDNSICSMFFLLLLLLQGIRLLQQRKILPGILLLLLPFAVSLLLLNLLPLPISYLLLTTVLPSPFLAEGGIVYLGLGILLYLFRGKKKVQFTAFLLYSLGCNVLLLLPMVSSPAIFFTDYFQWMEIFALVPLWLYSGERGRSSRWFFYVFYPAHIYLLWLLSFLVL